jgi:dTDP-4-dehydrorhamnose reductase
MKVLLLGHKGWIGQKVLNILKSLNIDYLTTDLRGEDDNLKEFILNSNITHIYCCLGRTHGTLNDKVYTTIDYLENKETLHQNINDNLYTPLSLAMFSDKHNIHFTHIGTGCIFSDEEYKFTENDKPNFFGSNYSIVKGFTDMLIKNTNALILRIRMPISSDKSVRNFITKIITYEKICSIANSMSVLDELLPLSIEMMKNNEKGCFNFTNPGIISHNEILEMYKENVDNSFTWKNMTIEEQNKLLLSKRSNNHLDTSKLEFKYEVSNIKDGVRKCLSKM